MPEESHTSPLVTACWPVFEFVTNFDRQLKYGGAPDPKQARYDALSALRDVEELARDDPATERLWYDYVKPMMVYLIDYRMLNTEWDGRDFWFDNRFETDREVLDHVEALGGEKFFTDCDTVQRDYDTAEKHNRRDRNDLAAVLDLYYMCLRLGFKGRFHDYPLELADYTRRLFSRLPSYGRTKAKEMFPEAYQHNQEIKPDYKLGMKLTLVLLIFGAMLVAFVITFRFAWDTAVKDIADTRAKWSAVKVAAPGGTTGPASGTP